jgi:polygalacturonase
MALSAPGLAAPQPIMPPAPANIPSRSEEARSGDSTAELQAAIDRLNAAGGGTLVLKGRFVTGTLFLKSRTRLFLAEGAELVGSDDLAAYPRRRVRWEGRWIEGHCSLLHADDAEDIAIAGPGKIVGSPAVGGMPSAAYPFRHPALIEPVNCRHVLLEGFSTEYDHMWNIHPTLCDDVTIEHLTIRSSEKGRDGIDIDSCRRVRIARCDIATGDDCISLKSGRGMEGFTEARSTENVLISDCTFADWNWACIGIGSEMSGGVRAVRIENCRFVHAKTHALYLKGQVGRGGYVQDIEVVNAEISGCLLGAIRINFLTSGKRDERQVPGEAGIPRIANFRFTAVRVRDVPQVLEAWEIDSAKPLEGLVLENITGSAAKGLQLAHIRGARIARVKLDGLTGPLLATKDVTGTGLHGAAPLPEALKSKT